MIYQCLIDVAAWEIQGHGPGEPKCVNPLVLGARVSRMASDDLDSGYPARGALYTVAAVQSQEERKMYALMSHTFRSASLALYLNPDLFITLFTDKPLFTSYVHKFNLTTTHPFASVVFFDDIMDLTKEYDAQTSISMGYGPVVWAKKIVTFQHTPYPVSLFMDGDTCFCHSEGLEQLFQALDGGMDIAYIHEKDKPGPALEKIPERFRERNTGVVIYASNIRVHHLLQTWEQYFYRGINASLGQINDQPSLREALYDIQHKWQRSEQVKEKILSFAKQICRGFDKVQKAKCIAKK
eukprot:gene8631-10243_t